MTETRQSERETRKPQHRLRNFMVGVGTLVGGLVLLDVHEVKDPTKGVQVVGAGTEFVKDLVGKDDNIYLDWVDMGAIAISTLGAAITIEAISRRPEES